MNKRAIVNVATGEFYCKMQKRLIDSFLPAIDTLHLVRGHQYDGKFIGEAYHSHRGVSTGIDLFAFLDCLPKGSRPHSESPYGFKVWAIKAAYEMCYTSILWLDSPAYAVKDDISPIFDKIEKEGYYAMSHIDPLERFVGDSALKAFGMYRDSLKGLNLPSGSCYGMDLTKASGKNLFNEMKFLEAKGLFANEINGGIIHRHDEACLALALKFDNLPVFTFDPLFQSDSPECVIKSGGR